MATTLSIPSLGVSRGPAEKVTADNITDEQIEALKLSLGSPDRDYLTAEEQRIAALCNVATIEGSRLGERARARCAEILNARAEAK